MRVLLAALVMLSGCLTTPDVPAPGPQPVPEGAIVLEHDHNDPFLHTGRHALAQVTWTTLGVTLGEQGFANFVLWPVENEIPLDRAGDDERLLLVAIDGDDRGGFAIADARDPRDIRLLGRYEVPGNGFQEVRITPDGRTALLNVQEVPSPGTLGQGAAACSLCIHIVDIEDRTQPRLLSVHPVELLGTHNLHVEDYGGTTYVFYVGQPLYLPWPDPGNHVWVARLEEAGGRRLVPVASFDHNDPQRTGRGFPHDVLVQTHPSGRKLAYVSYWDSGLVVFDVTNPFVPVRLAVVDDPVPSDALAIHWAMQEPRARADGRTIVYSAPEIQALDSGTGVLRVYDATDPAALVQIGTWELPGDLRIDGQFILSPHTAVPDVERGLLALTHYHAGVWVLDVTEPEHPRELGYYLPHGDEAAPYMGPLWWKKPNFNPEGYGPNVYQARWRDGLLWVSDRGTGIYVLDYTGPSTGPI